MLTLLIFSPLVFASIVALMPTDRSVRLAALGLSSVHFLMSCVLFKHFDVTTPALQMVEKKPWLPDFGISYFIAIDGISFWLVLLTTFLAPIVVLASWTSISERVKAFHVSLFVLCSTMVGSFLAFDVILFYVFFEAALIPMYFMIGIWGGARRLYATIKFFIFTMFGSLFMLAAIIALILMAKTQLGHYSAALTDLYGLNIAFFGGEVLSSQTLLMFAFALAFAIKVPMFPFHTWLPDAHVEAPTPGSVILAAVMLKMGTYGFLRFALPLFPEAIEYWSWLFIFISVIGIIYGALVAMVQPDIKKLVAYSSVSHMGYVMLGIFTFNTYGLTGALYQMLNHGVSTGALFLLVGMIYEKTHSREINKYGGLASVAPWFTIAFIIITMSSIAVPLTNGFIGEFLILLGAFLAHKGFAIAAAIGVVLGAAYMLWMVKRVFFGQAGPLVQGAAPGSLDINWREKLVLAPFVLLVFWMGVMPQHFLKFSKASIEHLVNKGNNYNLQVHAPNTKEPLARQER